ncbi:hypothetical protein AAVH_20762 [Aphelenchoides avenae]|nr:hypothetical protein AAVH_20762 [Aphelenchus avenae]
MDGPTVSMPSRTGGSPVFEGLQNNSEELRLLRQELRDRDIVIKRLQSKLGAQCAAELENRKLQQELRQLKDGLVRLLQEDPHLRDKLTTMTVCHKVLDTRLLFKSSCAELPSRGV